MSYYGFLEKTFGNLHPLLLSMVVDLLKLIPYVDFIITVPLQWLLWSKQEAEFFKYTNIIYDSVGDFIIPGIGDIFPLNTVCVLLLMLTGRLK